MVRHGETWPLTSLAQVSLSLFLWFCVFNWSSWCYATTQLALQSYRNAHMWCAVIEKPGSARLEGTGPKVICPRAKLLVASVLITKQGSYGRVRCASFFSSSEPHMEKNGLIACVRLFRINFTLPRWPSSVLRHWDVVKYSEVADSVYARNFIIQKRGLTQTVGCAASAGALAPELLRTIRNRP